MNKTIILLTFLVFLLACQHSEAPSKMTPLKISDNHRFLCDDIGNPFFWLGDTGWLLFSKLTREEADTYLEDRKEKGFNIIQVMVLHGVGNCNVYGDSALVKRNVAEPLVTPGNNPGKPEEYDFWDHVDYIIGKAEEKGIYMGLVPVWGSNVKAGLVRRGQAEKYARWLAERYRDRPNIIWLNGGDTKGSDSTETWKIIGKTLRKYDARHLITFHPFGRMQSSDWFHREEWLDFNMFQSGHRRYDQDDSERKYGEDNWRYAEADYGRQPVKPTLDGEPSYEGIPQGLHDTLQPLWRDSDVRRYAYWSVFAGGCGFTYGHSAVMQFYKTAGKPGAYGNKKLWSDAIHDPGAGQMQFLKKLMLSRSYFDRIPDQSLIAGPQGEKYDFQAATRGKDYALIYTYNGKTIPVNLGKTGGADIKAAWYNPRNGIETVIGTFPNSGIREFDPPGEPADGNDWVLVLDAVKEPGLYLFSTFREPATEGLYLAWSEDGYHWNDLGGPWLKPEVGIQKVMRDPSVVQGPDGIFHMVWTSSWQGDKGFGYASSEDLIHWSVEQFIPVMSFDTSTVNVWAPELFFDDEKKEFLIIWSSTIPFKFPKGEEEERNNHRLYYTTTPDFKTFSETQLYYDPGFSVIDAVLVKRSKDDYVLVLKDNTRPYRNLRVVFGSTPTGPFTGISEPFTAFCTEGPTVLKVMDKWLIYFDAYREKVYGAVETTDFVNFRDISAEISLPSGHKHGTVFMVNQKTPDKLISESEKRKSEVKSN